MRVKKGYLWLFPVAVCCLFTVQSCVPAYIPNVVNAPLLSEEGEVVAKINTGIAGFDPQLAYAVTDQLGVMLNGSFRATQNEEVLNYHRHAFGEVGAGYFHPFNDAVRFEVFAGSGLGLVNANYTNSIFEPLTNVRYVRGFLQPTIGFVTDVAEFSITPRFTYVYMMQGDLRSGSPFFEPVTTLKLGYKHVKGMMQIGFAFPFSDNYHAQFDYQPFMMALGIQFKIVVPRGGSQISSAIR